MNHILLVEDDLKIANLLQQGLQKEKFIVSHFVTRKEVMLFLDQKMSLSLIILDLMLPDVDGLDFLKELRSLDVMVPVLILSAKSSVDDRIAGLRSGGDDYLVKPFAFAELLARIEAKLRRNLIESRSGFLQYMEIKLDLLQRSATRSGEQIELHEKEFLLLELFLRNPSKVFSKKMILDNVYGSSLKAQSNLVDVLVFRLRHKIDKPFQSKYIHTVHGLGYMLEAH